MRKIIMTNKVVYIKKHFLQRDTNLKFIILNENKKTLNLKRHLLEHFGIKEITRKEFSQKYCEYLKKEFCEMIRVLSQKNNSVEWWAMNFTNKNPLMSKLFENIFHFLCIQKFTVDYPGSSLIILSDNKILAKQLQAWAKANSIVFYFDISTTLDIKEVIQIYTPLLIVLSFLKVIFCKLLSYYMLEKIVDNKDEKIIIITQFEDRSIIQNGIYQDIYFGNFKKLLKDFSLVENITILTIGYSACNFINFIKNLKRRGNNRNIYPIEYFIKIKHILKVLITSFKRYFLSFSAKKNYKIFDLSLSILLRNEIKQSISSGQLFVNMSVYYSLLSISQNFKVKSLYYPFENKSWEKMLILACKKSYKDTRIIGYQHSSIIPKHLNFYLGRGEYNEMPMPDEIITLGEMTKDILEYWNFPKNIIRVGCALRHGLILDTLWQKKKIKNILVALASDIVEYVSVLIFLDEAFSNDSSYNVVIRPHPVISFRKALRIFTPIRLKYKLSESTLEQDLANSDAVLYASSTVCLDAISIGKPVIYLELDDFLNSDPMFNADILKWKCFNPKELVELIKKIDSMEEHDIYNMQQNALIYTSRYFYAVNKENLANFLS